MSKPAMVPARRGLNPLTEPDISIQHFEVVSSISQAASFVVNFPIIICADFVPIHCTSPALGTGPSVNRINGLAP